MSSASTRFYTEFDIDTKSPAKVRFTTLLQKLHPSPRLQEFLDKFNEHQVEVTSKTEPELIKALQGFYPITVEEREFYVKHGIDPDTGRDEFIHTPWSAAEKRQWELADKFDLIQIHLTFEKCVHTSISRVLPRYYERLLLHVATMIEKGGAK